MSNRIKDPRRRWKARAFIKKVSRAWRRGKKEREKKKKKPRGCEAKIVKGEWY